MADEKVELVLDIVNKSFLKGMDDAKKSVKEFGKVTNKAMGEAADGVDEVEESVEELSTAWDTFKGVLGAAAVIEAVKGVGTALVDTFQSAIDQAKTLEKGMAEVSTLMSGTAQDTKALTNDVLDLQARFGTEQADLTKAYYQALSSGAVDASTATTLLETASKLAIGGVTELNVAVDGLTTILNAYGEDADQATSVSDALFIAMRAGKTTVAELSGSIGQGAAIAAQLGVSYQELLASVSAITTGGVSTSEAMTQVRSAMVSLLKPTAEMEKALDLAGIESVDLAVKQDGLNAVLKKVVATTDGSSSSIATLTGRIEGTNAVMALTGDKIGPTFISIMEDMDTAAENMGDTTNEAFDKMAGTTAFLADQLKGTISAELTKLGTTILPFLNEKMLSTIENIKTLSQAFVDFSNWVEDNSDGLIILAGGLGTAAAAFVAYTVAVNAAAVSMGIFAGAISAAATVIAVVTAPITLVVAGITALGAAVTALVINWDELTGSIGESSEAFTLMSENLVEQSASTRDAMDESTQAIVDNLTALQVRSEFITTSTEADLDTVLAGIKAEDNAKKRQIKEEAARNKKFAEEQKEAQKKLDDEALEAQKIKLENLKIAEEEAKKEIINIQKSFNKSSRALSTEIDKWKEGERKKDLEAEKKALEAKQKDEENFFAWRKSNQQRETEFRRKSLTDQVNDTQKGLAAMTGLMKSSSKEAFALGKAAAISNALIDTYRAANAAFAAMAGIPIVGPGLGAAAAAGAIAAGIAQVNQIRSQRFATGGIVDGTSVSGDLVPINVNSGEMVLNKAQQTQLFGMANGEGGVDSNKVDMLEENLNLALKQPIVVQVDGAVIAQVVRDQDESGFGGTAV